MIIQEALLYGRSQLSLTSPTPALDARLLLQHITQRSHSALIAHGDERLTDAQNSGYQSLLQRAQQQEPVPYLTGQAPFYGQLFQVTPAVLIPRPETEQLVEKAIAWAHEVERQGERLQLVDVGTGSGCIAISVARALPQAQIAAIDISAAALTVAQDNAARLAPARIHFSQGSLLSPVTHPLHLILANLPYVTDQEWSALDDGVKLYEPAVALKGGRDGLDLVRTLLHQATAKLHPGGAVLLEIGWRQGAAVVDIAQTYFPAASVQLFPDLAGHDRLVLIQTRRTT